MWLPSLMMYSAAISHSEMVAERPLFKITGLWLAYRSQENEVLHVPRTNLEGIHYWDKTHVLGSTL